VLAGATAALGKGSRSSPSAKGEATCPSNWTKKEFEGWVKIIDSNAWAGFKLPK